MKEKKKTLYIIQMVYKEKNNSIKCISINLISLKILVALRPLTLF